MDNNLSDNNNSQKDMEKDEDQTSLDLNPSLKQEHTEDQQTSQTQQNFEESKNPPQDPPKLADTSMEKFEPAIVTSNFENDPNFFGRMNMFNESEVLPSIPSAGMESFGFNEGNENYFPMNYPPQGFNGGQLDDNYGYDMQRIAMGDAGAQMGYNNNMMYPDQMMNMDYGVEPTPDVKLRPASLSDIELQKEMASRGLLYQEGDRVGNIAHIIAYLLDRNFGESDLSSQEEIEETFQEVPPTRSYNYLEVILVNCDSQSKPLLDWLETWKNASKDVNSAQIYELPSENLIKIRIFNKFAEPCGVIDELNSVEIKCARYFCYSRGDIWGGWEYYENGTLRKQEEYNAGKPPPSFWRRLCWLENIVENPGDSEQSEKLRVADLTPSQICAVLGTDEEMVCADCGNFENVCHNVHSVFNAQFKSKDLYNRHTVLVNETDQ